MILAAREQRRGLLVALVLGALVGAALELAHVAADLLVGRDGVR